MSVEWRIPVLDQIESQIGDGLYAGDPLNADKWLASSALQKCIRRGLVQLAQGAAARYYRLDRVGLRRRLIAIAFEDIGAADPAAVVETVTVATCGDWRAKHGETRVLLYIVERLAKAPKDRSADLLILAAHHHPTLDCLRAACRDASMERRRGLLADQSLGIAVRAVAAWFSSGLEFPRQHFVGPGSLAGLAAEYRALGVGDDFVEATMMAARRTREPLTIAVPLVWLEIQHAGNVKISDAPIADTPVVDGLPLCAIDEHTQPGKQAINRLVAENMHLRACLERFVPKSRWTTAAQHAAFYADGSLVAPRLDWSQSQAIEMLGIEADLASAQVPIEGVRPLREVMHACLPQLNEIRREIWDGLRQRSELSPANAD
jgi:hypothetical protein